MKPEDRHYHKQGIRNGWRDRTDGRCSNVGFHQIVLHSRMSYENLDFPERKKLRTMLLILINNKFFLTGKLNSYEFFEEKLFLIRDQIEDACSRAGRLIRNPPRWRASWYYQQNVFDEAGRASGAGENIFRRSPKSPIGHPVPWHFIGHLQKNKANSQPSI